MKLAAAIFSAAFYVWLAFALALSGCARLSQAWQEADYRVRYAPIAKEAVRP